MYSAEGSLNYKAGGWLVVDTSMSICAYYRGVVSWLTGKKATLPLHGAHITVIAGKYNDVTAHPSWRKYQGEKVVFYYDGVIKEDDGYYWIMVTCPRLAEIRAELGLSPEPFWPYHLTCCYVQ